MYHSPVNNAQLSLTFGEVITTSRYSCTRTGYIPHPSKPDLQLEIQVITYGEEISRLLLDADESPHFVSGELHQSKVDGKTIWKLYPYLLFPYTNNNPINTITITGRFGGKFRKSFYSTSTDLSGVRDSIAVPCHHTLYNKEEPKSPSNRSWLPVVAFEKLAELIEAHTHSGTLSSITGFLAFREKEGIIYSDIQVSQIQFLHSPDKKPEGLEAPELVEG